MFKQSSYVVWRRYKDFEWLREMLEKHNPTLIIPVRNNTYKEGKDGSRW